MIFFLMDSKRFEIEAVLDQKRAVLGTAFIKKTEGVNPPGLTPLIILSYL